LVSPASFTANKSERFRQWEQEQERKHAWFYKI
jgi:hypothetical protein